jgi:EAL domain-containing protein (putative c-di-GMP-specific phosphodiesterase class I)
MGSDPARSAADPRLDDPRDPAWEPILARAVAGDGVTLAYQPIVDVARGVVAGYESLARFDCGATPDKVFAAAFEFEMAHALDAVTLGLALSARATLPGNTFITVNIEPESMLEPAVTGIIDAQGSLAGIVFEITEHRPLPDSPKCRKMLAHIRSVGAIIAVDDAGAGYAGLQQILRLRPELLKIDRDLVTGIDTDEARVALVEMIGTFANRIDAWLLAEGVETAAEADRLATLGVPLAQGWFYGRPGPPWVGVSDEALDLLERRRERRAGDAVRETVELIDEAVTVVGNNLAEAQRILGESTVSEVVCVDEYHRPIGVVTAASALDGRILTPLRVNLATTPSEIAHRITTHDSSVDVPVTVTDERGRFVGVVTLPRLLRSLAED